MLVFLVLFVFLILTLSLMVSGLLFMTLLRAGIIPPLSDHSFPSMLIFLLMVSLLISAVLSTIMGKMSLRPMKRFIDATKQIAMGNFDVRVEPHGPDEMIKLADSFNDMARELNSIETLRTDFVDNVSHEFKTPVVSIRGFAKLLKNDDLTPGQRNEYLDIIISESDRLATLSSNVLLLSKLGSEEYIETARYPLDEQLRKCILLLEPQITKKKLNLDIELDSLSITASEDLLQHVWINILSNAIKFTPENGTIGVKLKDLTLGAEVTITDSGVGMDKDVQRHLFDKFYQGDESHSTEGNGLGMALVKRILDLCDGDITVSSLPGAGTEMVVAIPRY